MRRISTILAAVADSPLVPVGIVGAFLALAIVGIVGDFVRACGPPPEPTVISVTNRCDKAGGECLCLLPPPRPPDTMSSYLIWNCDAVLIQTGDMGPRAQIMLYADTEED